MIEALLLLMLLALAYAWAERRGRTKRRRTGGLGVRASHVQTGGCPTRPFPAEARAVDGDSLTVVLPAGDILRVRLQGIDAPELDQAEGRQAFDVLRGLVGSGACDVEPHSHDKYGRLVARVQGAAGGDLGLRMIAAGYAIALHPCPNAYHQAERRARAACQGAWGRAGFMRPSAWRHRDE